MKKLKAFLMMSVIVCNVWACSETTVKKDLQVDRSNVVSVTATVEAINQKTRMVTIKGTEGRLVTFKAGKEVVNLPQVQVGDKVVLDYIESLAVRMAKPGEVRDETVDLVGAAAPGSKPAAIGATETTVTATIEALDKKAETVTLKGPDGGVRIVKVQDPANLDKVEVGDTILITYTEAVALSVQTVKP